jgi:hypothetical protein
VPPDPGLSWSHHAYARHPTGHGLHSSAPVLRDEYPRLPAPAQPRTATVVAEGREPRIFVPCRSRPVSDVNRTLRDVASRRVRQGLAVMIVDDTAVQVISTARARWSRPFTGPMQLYSVAWCVWWRPQRWLRAPRPAVGVWPARPGLLLATYGPTNLTVHPLPGLTNLLVAVDATLATIGQRREQRDGLAGTSTRCCE